jgi:hypothetical protein
LSKTGAGAKGFDYTKVCWNGDTEGSGTCTGALVANTTGTATGSPTTDWACTRDNVTNLIWSLQSASGGWEDGVTMYPSMMNTATRCGYNTGWRLPTLRELLSLVHHGAWSPAIDSAYFPATWPIFYWSADATSSLLIAWIVHFYNGSTGTYNKNNSYYIRLVRSGQ